MSEYRAKVERMASRGALFRIFVVVGSLVSLAEGCNGCKDDPTVGPDGIECRSCQRLAVQCDETPVRVVCVDRIEQALPEFGCEPKESKDCTPGGGSGGG